ncbi:hypothetical protein GCM10009811_35690 [Nostocoides veronense]|uniref:Uncharacterized protein n=1 Tax=Nostocoides veronense TaxID=330836 RepID=A0ABN2M4U6_9MICO
MVITRPVIDERARELRVPDQGWEIVEDECHADMIHGTVGGRVHDSIHRTCAAKDPQIASPGQIKCLLEGQWRAHHGPSLPPGRGLGCWL